MRKNNLIIPPIKSQGIKTKLIPWIADVIPNVSGKWIEPFLGTGVVAFNSEFDQAILNDTNPHIINFYKKIQTGEISAPLMRQYLEEEGEKLKKAGNAGYDYYINVRDRFNGGFFSSYDFIFLSRAGFNGMMRFNKNGYWNIPFCKKPERFAPAYITKITNQVKFVSQIIKPEPDWVFFNRSFEEIILMATENDLIYCDPPYYGRNADYYNGWTEENESLLFELLFNTKAKFVLSTWHHNDWRSNNMVEKYWKKFNILTRDHFYHNGGKIENRKSVVEALVCNFDISNHSPHNRGNKQDARQLKLDWLEAV